MQSIGEVAIRKASELLAPSPSQVDESVERKGLADTEQEEGRREYIEVREKREGHTSRSEMGGKE